MADSKCPNCGQFKYSKQGSFLIIGSIFFSLMALWIVGSWNGFAGSIVGIGILIMGVLAKINYWQKDTHTYKCENCEYTGEHWKPGKEPHED